MAKAPTEIRSLARGHTETALNVLVGIMNARRAPHSAKVAAANAILDRGWGKPTLPIKGEDGLVPQVVLFRSVYETTREEDAAGVPPRPYIPRDYSKRD